MVDRARGFVLQFIEVDQCKSMIVQNALDALMFFPGPDLYTRFCVSAFPVMTHSVVYTLFLWCGRRDPYRYSVNVM